LDEFLDEPSITALNDAFDDVISQSAGEYLEVTEGANAVVAAQIVSEIFFEPRRASLVGCGGGRRGHYASEKGP
jgi:hypothetical protein